MEKINLLLKDYTIDYEEYFNRQEVWCNGTAWSWFTRDVGTGGYCANFSAYGNDNYLADGTHKIYYCSSIGLLNEPWVIAWADVQNGNGCAQTGYQSFGEYYRQFRDVKNDVDSISGAVGDEDDQDVLKWPAAISDATGVQELYLISQDGKQRVYLRRALIESGDWNKDGITWNVASDNLYTLQILKLRGFDAGTHHDFDPTDSSGVYDGNIDTRACDYAQGFICHGSGVGPLYSWYALPADANDGRVNLFDQDLTVNNRNLVIYPTKNPDYALAQDEVQINPYFTISLSNSLYGKIWYKKLWLPSLDDFQLSLQTSFSTKGWYTK